MPPIMAIRELMAIRPETLEREPAVITLKPNQPMQSSQDPSASHGIDDGGMPMGRPLRS